MLVAEHEKGNGGLILRIKGELDGSSVIQLDTFLGKLCSKEELEKNYLLISE